jgi:hypothetical protein
MIRNVRSLELESPAYLKATARECVNSHNRACKDSSAETSIPKVLSSLRAHCACHCASAIETLRTHCLHRLSLKLPSGKKKKMISSNNQGQHILNSKSQGQNNMLNSRSQGLNQPILSRKINQSVSCSSSASGPNQSQGVVRRSAIFLSLIRQLFAQNFVTAT